MKQTVMSKIATRLEICSDGAQQITDSIVNTQEFIEFYFSEYAIESPESIRLKEATAKLQASCNAVVHQLRTVAALAVDADAER